MQSALFLELQWTWVHFVWSAFWFDFHGWCVYLNRFWLIRTFEIIDFESLDDLNRFPRLLSIWIDSYGGSWFESILVHSKILFDFGSFDDLNGFPQLIVIWIDFRRGSTLTWIRGFFSVWPKWLTRNVRNIRVKLDCLIELSCGPVFPLDFVGSSHPLLFDQMHARNKLFIRRLGSHSVS